ncbi:MAG: leucine-rich repeat domain-containing protein [Treponemataceae bacterium]|nr:leucine-rich repeat domain-containing protein [Treponemataceae bacterium]
MKGIYLEKNNSMEHFISNFNADEFTEIDSNAAIAKSAFAHSDVEKILFKGKDCSEIGESAFEGCESLATVIFGEVGTDETIERSVLKNLKLAAATGDYVIQANAFNGCGSLTTLVLPEVKGKHKLVIENDAFCACGSLRTVVALCDTIDFTGNPFANEAEHLTFICKENSGVARFARENGYRSVYVD